MSLSYRRPRRSTTRHASTLRQGFRDDQALCLIFAPGVSKGLGDKSWDVAWCSRNVSGYLRNETMPFRKHLGYYGVLSSGDSCDFPAVSMA